MKKIKTLLAVVCAATILSGAVAMPAMACTPKLNPPSIKIPEITVKLDKQTEDAIKNAAQNFIEKNVLEKPVIRDTYYFHRTFGYGTYSFMSVQWDNVENATSYEVEVTKTDGSKKNYTTYYNVLVSVYDEFLADGMDGATVRVEALGENETFSLWSDAATVNE